MSLYEQLSALEQIDDLLSGSGAGEYFLGSAGEPWAAFPWAAYPGYRENGYGWYGRYNYAGSEAGARRTDTELGEVSGPNGIAITAHLRQAEGEPEGYFELWAYASTEEKSGWRLAAYPEGEETENYELRLEFWYRGSNERVGSGFGGVANGVHIPAEFSEGPTRFGLYVTGNKVSAVVFHPETEEWAEYIEFTEVSGYTPEVLTNEFLIGELGGVYLGIGGKNVVENYDPVLSDLSYGEVTLEEVAPEPPVNTVAPAITGTVQVRQTLSTTTGAWEHEPTAYTYQWQHSATGVGGWVNIGAATAESYKIAGTYLNEYLRCVVTASNGAGSAEAASAATAKVAASVPVVVTGAASAITTTSATIAGTANPKGLATTYWFEYGKTEAYGSKTEVKSAGSGEAALEESAALAGLSPATTYHFRIVAESAGGTANGTDATFATEAPPAPSTAQSVPPPQISVMAIAEGGRGRGFDLTDDAVGVVFSNVNPGGDENCSFTLARSWFAENPELGKGNLLLILAGIDVLWQGRIEETDRSTGDQEQVAVTAYGLGNRLSDNTMREIYIDRDQSKWQPQPLARRLEFLTNKWTIGSLDQGINPVTGNQALILSVAETWPGIAIVEAWYDSGSVGLGFLMYERTSASNAGPAEPNENFVFSPFLCVDDHQAGGVGPGDQHTANHDSDPLTTISGTGQRFGGFVWYYPAAGGTAGYSWESLVTPIVGGTHGLILRGTWPNLGFTADQIAGNVIQRVPGITVRQIDSSPFVIQQFVIDTATHHLDVLAQVAEFAEVDYGTWGPNSPLDRSTNGYFDWKERDRATQHWLATRPDFEEDLTFHSELATLYDTVEVSYTDEAGISRTVTRSIYSRDLREAGLSPRTYSLDAGTTTPEGAAIYAEIFLAIFAGFAPARGSGTLAGTIRHYRRGKIPAYYLRADGSNIRIPDILPAETAFALDSTPDRRTTFPIQRVQVDLSGDYPKTNVSFDQASDALSILLAQQTLQAQIAVE